jgi:ABC-type spermidine/putrescine transport system permease subunit II
MRQPRRTFAGGACGAGEPGARAHFLWLIAMRTSCTLMPVFIAVAFSFNAGKAQTTWQGFSPARWYPMT